MFATICSRSRARSGGTASFSAGTSARRASIASFACSRSRSSSPRLRYPSDETVKTVWTSTSETFSCLNSASSCRSSSSWEGCGSCSSRCPSGSSAMYHLSGPDLLSVDLLQRPPLVEAGDLALGRSGRRDGQRDAELVGDRTDPAGNPLELRPGGPHLVRAGIEQRPRQPVADRAPEVLLDHPGRRLGQRLSLVHGACNPRRERVAEARQRPRLAQVGLAVADPDLHGRV